MEMTKERVEERWGRGNSEREAKTKGGTGRKTKGNKPKLRNLSGRAARIPHRVPVMGQIE